MASFLQMFFFTDHFFIDIIHLYLRKWRCIFLLAKNFATCDRRCFNLCSRIYNLIGILYLNNYPDSSRTGTVQFINLKSYDVEIAVVPMFLYHQHDKKQNGNTNTDKTDLFRQHGFFFLFSLLFFTFANTIV